jgi:hypothetical protein
MTDNLRLLLLLLLLLSALYGSLGSTDHRKTVNP